MKKTLGSHTQDIEAEMENRGIDSGDATLALEETMAEDIQEKNAQINIAQYNYSHSSLLLFLFILNNLIFSIPFYSYFKN
jgi:hypothetical protein